MEDISESLMEFGEKQAGLALLVNRMNSIPLSANPDEALGVTINLSRIAACLVEIRKTTKSLNDLCSTMAISIIAEVEEKYGQTTIEAFTKEGKTKLKDSKKKESGQRE
jgi:hypothetical protein